MVMLDHDGDDLMISVDGDDDDGMMMLMMLVMMMSEND